MSLVGLMMKVEWEIYNLKCTFYEILILLWYRTAANKANLKGVRQFLLEEYNSYCRNLPVELKAITYYQFIKGIWHDQ